MNTTHKSLLFLAGSALGLAAAPLLNAQDSVSTDPVGYVTVDLTAGADNFVSVPLRNNVDIAADVLSMVEIDEDSYELTPNQDLGMQVDLYAGTHYVRFTSGSAEGKFFSVVSNGSNSFVLDSLGDDLSGISSDDTFHVVQYWTLGELFDPATQNSLVVSTGNLPFQRGSQVLIPDLDGNGKNRAPKRSFFITSSEWRSASDFSNSDDVVVLPGSYIIVRQDDSAGERKLVISGAVPVETQTFYIHEATVDNDNLFSHGRPLEIRLDELGLGSEFEDSSGNLPFQRADQLLVWENPTGRNPAPDSTFFRVAGEWRRSSDFSNANDFKIGPNTAFIVRKKSQSVANTKEWKNTPNY